MFSFNDVFKELFVQDKKEKIKNLCGGILFARQTVFLNLFPEFAKYYYRFRTGTEQTADNNPVCYGNELNGKFKIQYFNEVMYKGKHVFPYDAIDAFFSCEDKKEERKKNKNKGTYTQQKLLEGFSMYLVATDANGYKVTHNDDMIIFMDTSSNCINGLINSCIAKFSETKIKGILQRVFYAKKTTVTNTKNNNNNLLDIITLLFVAAIFPFDFRNKDGSSPIELFVNRFYNDIVNPTTKIDDQSTDCAVTPKTEEYNFTGFTELLREISKRNAAYAGNFGRLYSVGELNDQIIGSDVPNLRPTKDDGVLCHTLYELIGNTDQDLFLVGQGGIGKSVTLISAAKKLSEAGNIIPYYIPLSLFCNEHRSFVQYIMFQNEALLCDHAEGVFLSNFTKWLHDDFNGKRFVLLLDGFNEISRDEQSFVLSSLQNDFGSGVDSVVRVVMTSREEIPSFVGHSLAKRFETYSFDELTLETAKFYLDKALGADAPAQYHKITDRNDNLLPYLRTPMAMAMECLILIKGTLSGLPYPNMSTKGELLGNYTTLLMGDSGISDAAALLAYNMAISGEMAVTSCKAYTYFDGRDTELKAMISSREARELFNIEWSGTDFETISFKHQDLRDYYAANYCKSRFGRTAENINACFGNRIPNDVLELFADLCGEHIHESGSLIQNKLMELGSDLSAVAVSQIIMSVIRVRRNDMSSFDFSGLDLTRTGLNGVILSTQSRKAVLGDAKISDRTFLPFGHTPSFYGICQLFVKGRFLLSFGDELLVYDVRTGLWNMGSADFGDKRVAAAAVISDDLLAILFINEAFLYDLSENVLNELSDIPFLRRGYNLFSISLEDDYVSLKQIKTPQDFIYDKAICEKIRDCFLRKGANIEPLVEDDEVYYLSPLKKSKVRLFSTDRYDPKSLFIYSFVYNKREFVSIFNADANISLYEVTNGELVWVTAMSQTVNDVEFMNISGGKLYSFSANTYYTFDADTMACIGADKHYSVPCKHFECVVHDGIPYVYSQRNGDYAFVRNGVPTTGTARHIQLGSEKKAGRYYNMIKGFVLPDGNVMGVFVVDNEIYTKYYSFIELSPELKPVNGKGVFQRELNCSAIHPTKSGIMIESHDAGKTPRVVFSYIPYKDLRTETQFQSEKHIDRIIPLDSSTPICEIYRIDEVKAREKAVRAICMYISPSRVSIAVYTSGKGDSTQKNIINSIPGPAFSLQYVKLSYTNDRIYIAHGSGDQLSIYLLKEADNGEYVIADTVLTKSFEGKHVTDIAAYGSYYFVSLSNGTIMRCDISDSNKAKEERFTTLPGLLCNGVDFSHTQGILSANLTNALKLIAGRL